MGGEMLFPQCHQPVSSDSRTETQHSFPYCKTHACASLYWTRTSSPGFGPALPPLMSTMNLDNLPKFSELLFSHLQNGESRTCNVPPLTSPSYAA